MCHLIAVKNEAEKRCPKTKYVPNRLTNKMANGKNITFDLQKIENVLEFIYLRSQKKVPATNKYITIAGQTELKKY